MRRFKTGKPTLWEYICSVRNIHDIFVNTVNNLISFVLNTIHRIEIFLNIFVHNYGVLISLFCLSITHREHRKKFLLNLLNDTLSLKLVL